MTERLYVDDIEIGGARRTPDPDKVKALAESMREIGLQHPISVWSPDGNETILLSAGLHRLEAAKLLGWEEIECKFLVLGDIDRRMWEIAENLHRAELTQLEHDEQVDEWIKLVDKKRSEKEAQSEEGISAQIEPKTRGRPESGVKAAARDLGVERNEAQRAVARVEKIAVDVRDGIRDNLPQVADTGAELDALAKLPQEKQREAVALVKKGEAKTVREAASVVAPGAAKPAKTSGAAVAARDKRVDAAMAAVKKLNETELNAFSDCSHEYVSCKERPEAN